MKGGGDKGLEGCRVRRWVMGLETRVLRGTEVHEGCRRGDEVDG